MGCPSEPIPSGWQVWRGSNVPPPLTQWAVDIRDHIDHYRYGQIAAMTVYKGQSVAAFKSHHTWTYRNGALVTGICIPGVSLLIPRPPEAAAADDLSAPDPTAAVFGGAPPEQTDWRLVTISGLAGAGIILAFLFALKHAGKASVLTR